MKYFWNLFIVLIAFLFQNSVIPYLSIFGIQPDILLVVIVSFAFLEGSDYGSMNGFFGGLLQDLLSIRGFGIGMISKILLGYGGGLIKRTIFSENTVLVAPAIALATVTSHVLYVLLAFLLGYQADLNLLGYALPQAIYNAVIGIPLFIMLERFWDAANAGQNKEVSIG